MLMLLVFLGLTVSMIHESKSQSALTGAIKLQQFYNAAAFTALNSGRSQLDAYWVSPGDISVTSHEEWRFSTLLAREGEASQNGYGTLFLEDSLSLNAGMLNLTYKVWVGNNADDPAYALEGMEVPGGTITTNWDIDGKIVLTAEIFGPGDTTNPVLTQSVVSGVVGTEFAPGLGKDAQQEGGPGPAGSGLGTLGEKSRLDLSGLH